MATSGLGGVRSDRNHPFGPTRPASAHPSQTGVAMAGVELEGVEGGSAALHGCGARDVKEAARTPVLFSDLYIHSGDCLDQRETLPETFG